MIVALYIPEMQAWRRSVDTGLPVVIQRRNRVTEVSADLCELGVTPGERVERVMRRFPTARSFRDDPAYELSARERLLYELNRLSPRIAVRFGRFYCLDIRDEPSELASTQALVHRANLGAGGAVDDRSACHAAIAGYRGAINLVRPGTESRFVADQSIRSLLHFAVSEELVERLSLFGCTTVGRLRRFSKRHLSSQFGSEGTALYRLLHREPCTSLPPWEPPPSIRLAHVFDERVREPAEWSPPLEQLCGRAIERLKTVQPTIVYLMLTDTERGSSWRAERLLKHPVSARTLFGTLRILLRRGNYPAFGRITLTLGGLIDAEYRQADLFDDRSGLRQACREIVRRFPNGLLRYQELDPDSPLPERQWRLLPLS